MKTIVINEEKSIDVRGIKTKEGGMLMKRIGTLMKKAQTDDDFRYAFNGLIALASSGDKITSATVVTIMPIIIANFYDEYIELLSDLTGLTVEEIEDLEIDKTVEITQAIVEETDFNKLMGLLKNFKGLQRVK